MSYYVKKLSFLNNILSKIAYGLLFLYLKTLRVQIINLKKTLSLSAVDPSGSVFLLWHDSLLLLPLMHQLTEKKPLHILISYSKDGDIASGLAELFPNVSALRVRHTGRQNALKEMIRLLQENNNILITPDGPRGPRHSVKDGAIFAAKHSGASIIPIVWKASRQITLHSWDRFKIPLPFSKITLQVLPKIDPRSVESSTLQKLMEREEETSSL
jgi:lysophospholipid acyltransferase (LPLAT)-like uncharacterized protein